MVIDYVKEGRIAIFTLINHPEFLNAIDPESAEELSKAFIEKRQAVFKGK